MQQYPVLLDLLCKIFLFSQRKNSMSITEIWNFFCWLNGLEMNIRLSNGASIYSTLGFCFEVGHPRIDQYIILASFLKQPMCGILCLLQFFLPLTICLLLNFWYTGTLEALIESFFLSIFNLLNFFSLFIILYIYLGLFLIL